MKGVFIIKKQEQKILLIIVALFWFAQYVYIPYQTPYLAAISVSTSFIGVIVGSYGISQLALRLPVGILADLRPNHRLFISLGTLCAGIASQALPVLPGFLSWFTTLASMTIKCKPLQLEKLS